MNVIDAIRHHSRMRPYDLAVVHPGGAATYLQLGQAIEHCQLRLRSEGIGPGTTVAVYVADPWIHVCLLLAAMLNGTATVSAHPNFDAIPDGLDVAAYLVDRTLPFTPFSQVIPVSASWTGEPNPGAPPAQLKGPGFPSEETPYRYFTSSGTTGTAKLIARTLRTQRTAAQRELSLEPLARGPNLCMMWLSTVGGFGTMVATLWHGALLVLATAPMHVLRAINLYHVASLRASPQQLQGLVDLVRGRPVRFPSLERIEVGGASTPPSTMLAARAMLCTNVVGVYGSTEAGLVAQTPAAVLQAHSDAAGYIVPGVELEIVDDHNAPVARGAEGIVRLKTPTMSQGYVGDPEASAAAFRDGWFYPGDIGSLGADGLLRITGRTDEMINAGGVKLSPVAVDDFLLTLPGVREAAAFARRQPGRPDEVWAAVVCGDAFDEHAVLASCRERLNSRAPVRLVRVEAIPRNAMGKPLRQQLTTNYA
jgi:acyl-coenzyme A synthetase/AMP-(fatty) acid ligase